MNKHQGHREKMQQAQNGAVFNVQAYFLYACNYRAKIIITKAFVLSIISANIAHTKKIKYNEKHTKTPLTRHKRRKASFASNF